MLAVIGGTGLYNIEGLTLMDELDVETPFGKPSAPIIHAKYNEVELLFLPRHGPAHQFLPHEINYRANIFALKQAGARQILGFSAVGSLREDIHPGEFVIPNQYFDFVKGNRTRSFFGEGLAAHISTAEPICKDLAQWVTDRAAEDDFLIKTNKTYACVDGPRLGTRAESYFLRGAGCDLVGMTNVPEVFLAREAQICYATICIVTDYDCWQDDPSQHVSVEMVISRYGGSLERAQKLLLQLLDGGVPEPATACREALQGAVMTPDDAITKEKRQLLDVLMA